MDITKEEHVKYYLEKGCVIEYDNTSNGHLYGSKPVNNFNLKLKNKKGKTLASTRSTVSFDKALSMLSSKIKEKYKGRNTESKPFAKMRNTINEITDLDFFNKDNVHHLSNSATFRGWDVIKYGDYCEINIHNAGNTVMAFPLFKKSTFIELNLNSIILENYTGEKEAFPKLVDAVKDYLDSPLKERLAEFGKEFSE